MYTIDSQVTCSNPLINRSLVKLVTGNCENIRASTSTREEEED
jgi:hypothetical protein